MQTIEERIAKAKEHVAKLERQKRIEEKNERDKIKKKEQRRNYIIGELVTKYFPNLSNFDPGTKAQNHITFRPLEIFLSVLADDQKVMKYLKEKTARKISEANKKENAISR